MVIHNAAANYGSRHITLHSSLYAFSFPVSATASSLRPAAVHVHVCSPSMSAMTITFFLLLIVLLQTCLYALQTAGNEQAYLVQQLLHQFVTLSHVPAFTDVKVHDDCYGIPRFVSATRSQQ
eukprot:GHRR01025079.1.p2 GENE.GHRR01025079.1~~GHRR01025079.1.p2  ORF type:complete len:122 (-),score=37.24 GHRR01025079.1:40-405(-)